MRPQAKDAGYAGGLMNISAFNWADWTILGILAFSTLASFTRGFVREAISLASWILAAWVAYKYGHEFGSHYLRMIEVEEARSLIGSAILFFAVLLFGAFINYSLSNITHISGLSVIDRTLGMAFGFARGVLFVAVLILASQVTQADKKSWWKESQMIPLFEGVSDWLKGFLPKEVEKLENIKKQNAAPGQMQEENHAPSSKPSNEDLPKADKSAQSENSGISIKLQPEDSSITITPAKNS